MQERGRCARGRPSPLCSHRGLYASPSTSEEDMNRTEEARRVAHYAAEMLPNDQLLFNVKEALLLPNLYKTQRWSLFIATSFQ